MEQKASEVILGMLIKQLNKKPQDVKMDMRIKEDLGADSLDIVEILMGIEDKYGVTVADDVVLKIKTVQDLVNAVDEIVKKK